MVGPILGCGGRAWGVSSSPGWERRPGETGGRHRGPVRVALSIGAPRETVPCPRAGRRPRRRGEGEAAETVGCPAVRYYGKVALACQRRIGTGPSSAVNRV